MTPAQHMRGQGKCGAADKRMVRRGYQEGSYGNIPSIFQREGKRIGEANIRSASRF